MGIVVLKMLFAEFVKACVSRIWHYQLFDKLRDKEGRGAF